MVKWRIPQRTPFLVNCLIGILVSVGFVLLLEFSFRTYRAFSHGKMAPLFYGFKFIGDGRLNGLQDWKNRNQQKAKQVDLLYANREAVVSHDYPHQEPTYAHFKKKYEREGDQVFRYRHVSYIKKPQTKRIIVAGGSFVWGYRMQNEQAWPFLLEQQLNQKKHKVEVVNAGLWGFNIHDVTLWLLQTLAHLDSDYFVLISAYNNHEFIRGNLDRPLIWKLNFFLSHASLLYLSAKEKLLQLKGKHIDSLVGHDPVENWIPIKVDPALLKGLIQTYKKRLAQIHRITQEKGSTFVLASQPLRFIDPSLSKVSLWDKKMAKTIEKKIRRGSSVRLSQVRFLIQYSLNLTAQDYALKNRLPFFDGASVYSQIDETLFFDEIHPSPKGNRLFAYSMAEFFEDRFSISSPLKISWNNLLSSRIRECSIHNSQYFSHF